MIRALYSLLGLLLNPLLALWLLRRTARGKEVRTRLAERFGIARIKRPEGTLLWIHAASVGEVQSILNLAQQFLQQNPAAHLLITSGTVTSAQLVAQQNLPRTIHQFTPIDTVFSVQRFLQHWQPDLALWVESEFWPQLLWQMQDRKIPTLLINARISEKTAKNWARWPSVIRSMLATFSAIYAGSPEDAQRLRALGRADVREAGNLKYDALPLAADADKLAILRAAIGDRPVWCAASTHASEEVRIVQMHRALLQQFPALLTIVVPRHALRGDEIAASLRAQNVAVAQRSKGEPLTPDMGIYLADTMGELGLFYRAVELVLIGGSLIAHGGHNPLEPAKLDCAIMTGPSMFNFADMAAQMLAHDAMQSVSDDAALQASIAELLRNKTARDHLIKNAQNFAQSAHGATAAILQHMTQLAEAK